MILKPFFPFRRLELRKYFRTYPTERQSRGTIGDSTDVPASDLRASITAKLSAIFMKLSEIPQLIHFYGVAGLNKTLTLDSGENSCKSMVSDGTFLFGGLNVNPTRIVKIKLEDLTKLKTVTLNAGESYCKIILVGTDIYAGTYTSPAKVIKVNSQNMSRTSALTFAAGENYCRAFASDGSYLFAGLGTSPAKIVKIDLNDFSIVATLTFPAGEDRCYCLHCDSSFLYVGLYLNPAKIVKIKLEDFTRVDVLTLDANEKYCRSFASDGSFLFVSLYSTPAKIAKIDLSDFTKVAVGTLDAGLNYGIPMVFDGSYLYQGLDVVPAKIAKWDPADLSVISIFPLSSGENYIYSMLTDETFLYTGLHLSPAKIVRRYIYPSVPAGTRKIDVVYNQCRQGVLSVYPSLASAITLTSSATAWTQGSYAEVIPANTIHSTCWVTGIILNNLVVDSEYEVALAIGLAASEIVKATVTHETHDANLAHEIPIFPAIKIPANARVACSCATENAAGDTCTVKLKYRL